MKYMPQTSSDSLNIPVL